MSDHSSNDGRLDSWKEIAAYLGRDMRTVMRWEKQRRLPVHRLPGGQAVFAYRRELDVWLKQGAAALQEGGQNPEPPVAVRRLRLKHAAVAAVVALAVIAVGVYRMPFSSANSLSSLPFRVNFTANTVEAFDEQNRTMWTYRFAKTMVPFYVSHPESLTDLVRIADLWGDGNKEVLATVPLRLGPNPNDLFRMEVDCFTSRGKLLWSYVPVETFRFGNYTLEGPWLVMDIFVSQAPKPAIWVALGHYKWGNSFVVQLDPATGKDTLRMVNTGTIYRLNEVRVSARSYLLVGGFNNEYAAGSLAVMDEQTPFAVSPQTDGTRHKCGDCPAGAPDYYFVFPRSELNRLRNLWEDSVRFMSVHGDDIEIEKAEWAGPELGSEERVQTVHAIYVFHALPTFRPFALRFDSSYDMLHGDLERQRRLGHALAACPERLHPEPVRLWTRDAGWTQVELKPVRAVD